MQKVIISILHYNNTSDTIKCLDSVLELSLPDIEVETYVLDNGSKEEFKINVSKYKKININVLINSYNAGFTGGHNLIYEKVQDKKFNYLLLLNNDSNLDRDCLKELVKTIEEANIGAVVPKIYFSKGREFHHERYSEKEQGKVIWYAGGFADWTNVMSKHRGVDEVDTGQYEIREDINFATGACLLLKNEVLEAVGLFDERYFLYYEDADLSQRILNTGYKIVYQPKAIVWHKNAGSSGSGSELHDYYLTRNRMLFGMKFAPLKIKLLLLNESIRFLINGRKWQKRGIRDFYMNRFGKGSYIEN